MLSSTRSHSLSFSDVYNTTVIDLVLELIKGGDLLDYILKNGGLGESMSASVRSSQGLLQFSDERESRRIAYQMCTAMAVRRCYVFQYRLLTAFMIYSTYTERALLIVI